MFDYFFEIFIMPYEQRIRAIREGLEPKKTEIIEDDEEISKRIIQIINKSEYLCICSVIGGDLQFSYINFFYIIGEILEKQQNGNHKGIRWITSINNNNDVELVKTFLKNGIQIRHVYNKPFVSFLLSNILFASTIEKKDERGRIITSLLSSNDPLYLDHYNAIFEEQWKSGIDAEDRINDIEKGRNINIKIIPSSKESLKLLYDLYDSAQDEVLILLPSLNGFYRAEKSNGFKTLNELGFKGLKIKVLSPMDYKNQDKSDKIKSNYDKIEFRSLQFTLQTINRITILDRSKTMILEIKDDVKDNFIDAFGLAIFIDGKSTASSYAAIFDSLWKQTEMYEQLQLQDKMQKEFINIAAHELRTPLQPILGLAEIVKNEIKDNSHQKELLDIVISNAKRLKKLSEDILDVTKIESHSLKLNKENFDINALIVSIIDDYVRHSLNKKAIKFADYFSKEKIIIYADKNRIGQVISNLIENSVKFISKEQGECVISIKTEKKKNTDSSKIVVVRIKDTGSGIDMDILPRLFTKFSSKSFQGTGVGLYISKNIIEAHGGQIWAENNTEDGKSGATFSFSLPFKDN
jgi:signal transduction histidine kinase